MKPYVGGTLPEEDFCRLSHSSYFVFVALAGHIKGYPYRSDPG